MSWKVLLLLLLLLLFMNYSKGEKTKELVKGEKSHYFSWTNCAILNWVKYADSFLKLIYFNWRITTLEYCDDFCHTSTWIGHRYTYDPASWNPFSPPLPWHTIPLGCLRAPDWLPYFTHQTCTGHLFYIW